MNLDDLTIGQAKELAALFGAKESSVTFTSSIGKKCIVRTYASGVFYGVVARQDGRMVEMTECRRLWYWKAAKGISLSAVAVNGVDKRASKITEAVPIQTILDAIEIIPASADCIGSIDATPVAEAS